MIPTVFKQSMLINLTIPTTVSQCIASSEKTASTHQEVSALLTGIRKCNKEGVTLAPDPKDPKKKCTMKMQSIVSCEHFTSTQSLASSSPTKTTVSAHPVMSASLTGIDISHEEAVPLASDPMKECTTKTMLIVSCEHSPSIRSVASSSSTKMTGSARQEVPASLTGLYKEATQQYL